VTKFHGDLNELRQAVEDCGLHGTWSDNEKSNSHTFRGKNGEILNWWPSRGTLQFQGKNQDAFRASLMERLDGAAPATPVSVASSKKIFVVHGHDREARDQLELVLMRLGLQPFILQDSDGQSKTIIEALEQNIYREAAFGIVLLTPDDFGYSKLSGETEKQPRARQNVILEMGMVMAALSREKMVILKKGALEMPSDAAGILYIEFNDHVRETVPKLAQRLQGAGFDIDPKKIAAASA
jgi:predicted nucleotide-binding protein